MALMEIDWRPGDKQLRVFGACWFAGLLLLTGILYWFGGVRGVLLVLLPALAAAGGILGLGFPRLMHYPYVILMALSLPIGFVVSHVVIAFVYYIVMTPIALVQRLGGRDALRIRKKNTSGTYWRRRPATPEPSRYLRQF